MKSRKIYSDFGVEPPLSTARCVSIEIREDGLLDFSAMDSGEAPERFYGKEDYEFGVMVKPEDQDTLIRVIIEKGGLFPQTETAGKDRETVLLDLLQTMYAGRFGAVDEFRDFCESNGIPFDWWVY